MDIFIPIVFPDYKISAFGKKWEDLGHAGVLFIHGARGTTKYFEYGRYVKSGSVRKLNISDAKIDEKTRKIDLKSLAKVLKEISTLAGHGTRISGVFIEQANGYQKALDYTTTRLKQNTNPKRKKYSLFRNNCGTFMQDTLEAAGIETPAMIDPRPNSYIEELRDDFKHLDYDPKSDKLVIKE